MSSLSDKSLLRAEIMQLIELRAEMEDDFQKKRKQTWYDKWNCPFAVTVLGGVFLAFATFMFQELSEQHQVRIARQVAIEDRKLNLLSSLNNEGNSSVSYLTSYADIQSLAMEQDKLTKSANRTAQAAARRKLDGYSNDAKQLYELYNSHMKVDAILLQIKALYRSTEVKSQVNAFIDAEQRLTASNITHKDVLVIRMDLDRRLNEISTHLGNELTRDNDDSVSTPEPSPKYSSR